MRITMFMPGLGPQVLGWDVHRDFARAVEQHGHRFELLTTVSGGSPPPDTSLVALETDHRWSRLGRLSSPFLRTPSLVPTAAALARHLRRSGSQIDLLHVEVAYPHGAAAVLAARASGWDRPIVVTPMGEDILVVDEANYGFRRYAGPRWLVSWTLRQATFVRCISPMLEARIARIAPATPRRIVPLSVSSDATQAADEPASERAVRRERARAAFRDREPASRRPLVLALGRLHPFKGIELLVRAMRDVPSADLVIAGPSLEVSSFGDMATRLLALAHEMEVSDRVRWIGRVAPEQALDLLAAVDVVAVPSILESLNKVCIEAAAVGTPFVVTETTGISAWVEDEEVGMVVPPSDPSALSRALNQILSAPRPSDLERGRAFVSTFSPRVVAAELVEIYESLSGA